METLGHTQSATRRRQTIAHRSLVSAQKRCYAKGGKITPPPSPKSAPPPVADKKVVKQRDQVDDYYAGLNSWKENKTSALKVARKAMSSQLAAEPSDLFMDSKGTKATRDKDKDKEGGEAAEGEEGKEGKKVKEKKPRVDPNLDIEAEIDAERDLVEQDNIEAYDPEFSQRSQNKAYELHAKNPGMFEYTMNPLISRFLALCALGQFV